MTPLADVGGRRSLTLAVRAIHGLFSSRSHFSLDGKHLMFLNTRSHRFLSRSLAMAFAVAGGALLSTVAQAQMATGSGCTNCGGASAPVAAYSQPMTTQYSQPMMQASYSASGTVVNSYSGNSCAGNSYSCNPCSSNSYAGCASTRRHCSSSHRAVRYRQPSRSCGTTYTSAQAYSGGCCSGSGAYPAANSYPMRGVSQVSHVSAPVMQTGAGCAGGNCR